MTSNVTPWTCGECDHSLAKIPHVSSLRECDQCGTTLTLAYTLPGSWWYKAQEETASVSRPAERERKDHSHAILSAISFTEVEGTKCYGKHVSRIVSKVPCLLCGGEHGFLDSTQVKVGYVVGNTSVITPSRIIQRREVTKGCVDSPLHVERIKRKKMTLWKVETEVVVAGRDCALKAKMQQDAALVWSPLVGGEQLVAIPYLALDAEEGGEGAYFAKDGGQLPGVDYTYLTDDAMQGSRSRQPTYVNEFD